MRNIQALAMMPALLNILDNNQIGVKIMKNYPFYTVLRVGNNYYIIAGWDYREDSQYFINDTLDTIKKDESRLLKRFLKTYSKKYVLNNLGINPNNKSQLANLDEFVLLAEVDFNGEKGVIVPKSYFDGIQV